MRASLLCLALCLCACGDERPPSAATVSETPAPPPTFRVAFVSDVKGYLEPCGCTSRPLGGLGRLGSAMRTLRRDDVPTIFVAVGDMFFGGEAEQDEGAVVETRLQAETLTDVLGELGLAALTIGGKDLDRGAELGALRERARFPFLALGAGARALGDGDEGRVVFEELRIVEAGPTKVAIIGVTSAFLDDETLERARTKIASARAEDGVGFVIALVSGDRRLARSVAELPGVDLVASGGLDQEHPSPPTRVRRALVVQAGRQGQRLTSVDVHLRGEGPFDDASSWSRESAREELGATIREREREIVRWEREGNTSPSDLDAQRRRVAEMKRELTALRRAPDLSRGNLLSARSIELAPEITTDTAIAERLRAHDRRVNEHNQSALADRLPIPVPEGAARYVGSARCESCHGDAYGWWRSHPHGRAYQTLVMRDKQFSLNCVGCHVTGYGEPGGATVTHNERGALVNVGCESCHGPGSQHVERPTEASLLVDVPEATCVACHNAEHSDRFEYRTYRTRLRVPGHGLPARR